MRTMICVLLCTAAVGCSNSKPIEHVVTIKIDDGRKKADPAEEAKLAKLKIENDWTEKVLREYGRLGDSVAYVAASDLYTEYMKRADELGTPTAAKWFLECTEGKSPEQVQEIWRREKAKK